MVLSIVITAIKITIKVITNNVLSWTKINNNNKENKQHKKVKIMKNILV